MSRHLHLLLLALLFEVSGVLSGSHFSTDVFSTQARGSLINNKLNKYIQYIIAIEWGRWSLNKLKCLKFKIVQ